MKTLLTFLFSFSFVFYLNAQITVGSGTIPDVGDVLNYETFSYEGDSTSYKANGENLNWSYNSFVNTGSVEETYVDINTTIYADSFPSANMIIELGGTSAAALRDDNSLSVIGIPDLGFAQFGIDGSFVLSDPFVVRATPFSYGDKIEDSFSFGASLPSTAIPGLDSIELPIPGATLDSLRFTSLVYKSEEATAWGTLNLNGKSVDVLKVEQVDTSAVVIEIGITLFGTFSWLDLSNVIGEFGEGFELPSGFSTTTYKFLSEDSKASVLELTEDSFVDSLGVNVFEVSGRHSSDFTLSSDELLSTISDFVISPNPSSNWINLHSNEKRTGELNIEIVNADGKQLMVNRSYQIGDRIDISNLINGHYYLFINEAGQRKASLAFSKMD